MSWTVYNDLALFRAQLPTLEIPPPVSYRNLRQTGWNYGTVSALRTLDLGVASYRSGSRDPELPFPLKIRGFSRKFRPEDCFDTHGKIIA